jgi:hypothetical protein
VDADRPFHMTFGQWLFKHSEWCAQRVESLLPSGDSSEAPLLLEIKTDISELVSSPVSIVDDSVQVKGGPSPPLLHGPTSGLDQDLQMRRIASMDAAVLSLTRTLQQISNAATQAAISVYEGQKAIVGSVRQRLDTAELVLKTNGRVSEQGRPIENFHRVGRAYSLQSPS